MKFLGPVLLFLMATQAHALSCMRLTPQSMYHWAHEADEIYVPVYGMFEYAPFENPNKTNKEDLQRLPKGYKVPGKFSGKYVIRNGFGAEANLDVEINVTCVAHWCGAPPPKRPVLALLERTENGHVLHQGACPSKVYQAPSSKDMRAFRSCLAGKACDP